MEELRSSVTTLFNIYAPNNPNNPQDGFEGSNTYLTVENRDYIIIKPTFSPPIFRLIQLQFTTVNVRKVLVTYKTTSLLRQPVCIFHLKN